MPSSGPPPAAGYAAPVPPGYARPSAKQPVLSLLLSFLLPGLGQIYNGEVGKGIGFMVGCFFAALSVMLFVGIVIAPALFIWNLVDAYKGAERFNARHGVVA